MGAIGKFFNKLTIIGLIAVATVGFAPASFASAATTAEIKEAQTIANKFGLQVGTVDGVFGAKTARGFCMFRYISGMTPSRASLDSALLTKMRSYNNKYSSLRAIPSGYVSGSRTYLVAQETCQMMVFAQNGYYRAVTPISTGKSGKETPNGTWSLGGTQRGWSCSTLYPESCKTQTTGRFLNLSDTTPDPDDNTKYGNMYNKRNVVGAIKVHGSTSVPTYPGSAGCVRIPVNFSDWMYDYVPANIPIQITGQY